MTELRKPFDDPTTMLRTSELQAAWDKVPLARQMAALDWIKRWSGIGGAFRVKHGSYWGADAVIVEPVRMVPTDLQGHERAQDWLSGQMMRKALQDDADLAAVIETHAVLQWAKAGGVVERPTVQ